MANTIPLSGERVTLRELTDDDFDAVHAYGSDLEVVRFLPWGPSSEEDTREFLATARREREARPRVDFTLAIVRREDDRLVGTIGLHKKGYNAMLGYALRRDAWGHGFGTEAARLLVDFGFRTLDLHRIWAGCDPENPASARILEKLGMRQEGHLREELHVRGEFRDTLVYAVLEREWRG